MSDKLFQILIVIGLFIASAVCLCAAVAIVYGLSQAIIFTNCYVALLI